jgi:hypothetical protein
MSELSHEARELIARARTAERADMATKKRVRSALLAHLGPPVPGPGLPTGAAAGSLGAGLSASKLVLICSLTAAGVVGTAALVKTRHAPEQAPTPRLIERQAPPVVARPALPGPIAVPVPAAAPSTMAVPEIGRPVLPEPVRKISLRAPAPRPSESAEAPSPAVAPVAVPERAAATAGPARAATAVPERTAAIAMPERTAVVAMPVLPSSRESQPSLDPASSWRSSNIATPVPDREVARITLTPKPSKECTTERELKLLSGAQAALRATHGQRALDLLEQHAATCPTATFWQERSAARVLALCLLHREPQALSEAAQLASLAPRSPLLARLRTSCAAAAVKP